MRVNASWVVLALVTTAIACGLCGDEEQAALASPDGANVARVFIRNCGATTPYVTIAEIRRQRRWLSDRQAIYLAKGIQEITLRWESSQHLVLECEGCPGTERRLLQWNEVEVGIKQTYVRPSLKVHP